MSTTAESLPADASGELIITDISAIPDEPPAELLYRHRPSLIDAARNLRGRWEVILTLAERDLRAAYKQAVLGIGWALINPVMTLLLFTIVFHKAFPTGHSKVPYYLFAYPGILAWGFFAGAVGSGTGSLLQNKAMMAKTHFPRECFPLSQVVESAFTSTIATSLLLVIFPVAHTHPKLATLWAPVYMAIELPFTIGLILLVSSIVVQMRDLNQLTSIGLQLGMFATPVVWNLGKQPGSKFYIPHAWQPLYVFLNPIGETIDGLRRSMLYGLSPKWGLVAVAMLGSILWMIAGFAVFKRLEVNFADMA